MVSTILSPLQYIRVTKWWFEICPASTTWNSFSFWP